jgi:hypothetical protein
VLGEALEGAVPAGFADQVLELDALPGQEFLVETALLKHGGVVDEILSGRLGKGVRVRVRREAAPTDKPGAPNDLRTAELARIRRMDAALDVAATELDLEIVDDRLPRSPRGS